MTGSVSAAESRRVLATVLFTDIVGSTARAEQVGDQRWHDLLDAHHATVRRELARYRGSEVKSLGTGFSPLSTGPARAVRCACAIAEAVRPLTLKFVAASIPARSRLETRTCRASLSTLPARFCARRGGRGPRVANGEGPGRRSGLRFNERGKHSLKGLQDPMELYAASN